MGYYEKDPNWEPSGPLFGEKGDKILTWATIVLLILAVGYFTLRVFEIIPSSV